MFLRKKKGYKTPAIPDPTPSRPNPVPSGGPGTRLKRMFRMLRFKPCSGCLSLAVQMDENGAQWCRDNFEYIVAQVCGRAGRQGYDVEAWKPWIERIVRIAIR